MGEGVTDWNIQFITDVDMSLFLVMLILFLNTYHWLEEDT